MLEIMLNASGWEVLHTLREVVNPPRSPVEASNKALLPVMHGSNCLLVSVGNEGTSRGDDFWDEMGSTARIHSPIPFETAVRSCNRGALWTLRHLDEEGKVIEDVSYTHPYTTFTKVSVSV